MWKITSHGFALQAVLIMAAMNLAERTDSVRQRRANYLAKPLASRFARDLGDCHGKSN
jgi:hypothetical protein